MLFHFSLPPVYKTLKFCFDVFQFLSIPIKNVRGPRKYDLFYTLKVLIESSDVGGRSIWTIFCSKEASECDHDRMECAVSRSGREGRNTAGFHLAIQRLVICQEVFV